MNRHNYSDQRPLLVIFHEPPATTALTDPRSRKINLHNIFVVCVPYAVLLCIH